MRARGRRRAVLVVVGVVLAVLVATVGVATLVPPDTDLDGTAGAADFARPELLWAEETTLHHGEQTFDLGSSYVRDMAPSPHGIFLEVARQPGYDVIPRWVFFDGTQVRELPGDPDDVKVSADGRYAGWLDRATGLLRPRGRVPTVVVVDLGTGDTVFRGYAGTGGFGDWFEETSDEVDTRFLGFDTDDRPYWTFGQRRRADLGTGRTETAEKRAPAGIEASTVAVGAVTDARRGTRVSVRDGKPGPELDAGQSGRLSPGGRWLLGYPESGRPLQVTRADTGEPVDLDLPGTGLYAPSWLGDDAISFLVLPKRLESFDGGLQARTPGRWVRCTLPDGACTVVARTDKALAVVGPGGSIPDDLDY